MLKDLQYELSYLIGRLNDLAWNDRLFVLFCLALFLIFIVFVLLTFKHHMLLKHLKKYNPETFKALNLDLGFYSPKFVTYGNVWRFWSFILHPDKLISSEDSEALSRIAVVRRLFIYYFGLFFICIFTMISLALMDYSLQQPSSFGELTDFHGWLSFVKSFLQPLIFTLGGHMILLSLLWTLMFYGIYNQLRRYEPEMCMQLQLPVKLSELSLRDNLTLGIFILFSSKWTHITKPGTIRAIIVARGILFICCLYVFLMYLLRL